MMAGHQAVALADRTAALPVGKQRDRGYCWRGGSRGGSRTSANAPLVDSNGMLVANPAFGDSKLTSTGARVTAGNRGAKANQGTIADVRVGERAATRSAMPVAPNAGRGARADAHVAVGGTRSGQAASTSPTPTTDRALANARVDLGGNRPAVTVTNNPLANAVVGTGAAPATSPTTRPTLANARVNLGGDRPLATVRGAPLANAVVGTGGPGSLPTSPAATSPLARARVDLGGGTPALGRAPQTNAVGATLGQAANGARQGTTAAVNARLGSAYPTSGAASPTTARATVNTGAAPRATARLAAPSSGANASAVDAAASLNGGNGTAGGAGMGGNPSGSGAGLASNGSNAGSNGSGTSANGSGITASGSSTTASSQPARNGTTMDINSKQSENGSASVQGLATAATPRQTQAILELGAPTVFECSSQDCREADIARAP